MTHKFKNNEEDNVTDDKIYCTCKQEQPGQRMICCDNPGCPIAWFHYKCVSIERKPKGQCSVNNVETQIKKGIYILDCQLPFIIAYHIIKCKTKLKLQIKQSNLSMLQ